MKNSDEMTHEELKVAYQRLVSDHRSLRVSLDYAHKEKERLRCYEWAIEQATRYWSRNGTTTDDYTLRARVWRMFEIIRSKEDTMLRDLDEWESEPTK